MTMRMQKVQLYAWYAATPLLGIVMQLRGVQWTKKYAPNRSRHELV